MKRSLPLIVMGFFALVIGMSCKKAIEKKAQDMLMDVITNGVWIVEQYFEGSNNISGQFLNYTFQFYESGTVTGTINTTSTNGTWSGSYSDYTITSNFPSADDPVKKLNGLWKIKDSDYDFVKAEMTTTSGTNTLFLRKK
jgi:hypothetical protein